MDLFNWSSFDLFEREGKENREAVAADFNRYRNGVSGLCTGVDCLCGLSLCRCINGVGILFLPGTEVVAFCGTGGMSVLHQCGDSERFLL